MAKVGRPSKINSIKPEQLEKLAAFGLTDNQMAEFMGVSEATFDNYKKHPEFLGALKEGKELSDSIVEASLFKRATGYSHPEEKIFCDKGRIVKTNTIKHYPPDTVACIFWLKNRKKTEWRDSVEHEIGEASRMLLMRSVVESVQTESLAQNNGNGHNGNGAHS